MDQARLSSEMAINMMEISLTGYCMVRGSLLGQTGLSMKGNLGIIVLRVEDSIDGLMEVIMREK